MNTHTFERASPPTNNAGPKLLAGFTDVPVKEIPRICTRVSERPITIPATALLLSFEVTPKTAITNTNVRITSIKIEGRISSS